MHDSPVFLIEVLRPLPGRWWYNPLRLMTDNRQAARHFFERDRAEGMLAELQTAYPELRFRLIEHRAVTAIEESVVAD